MANEFARSLRKTMTPQEVKLWVRLRALKELGYHFRRQSPIPPYIVDFECRRMKLVIELDGSHHGEHNAQVRDRIRDEYLHEAGFGVLRFWNNQIDREIEGVITIHELDKPLPTRLAPKRSSPLPLRGGISGGVIRATLHILAFTHQPPD